MFAKNFNQGLDDTDFEVIIVNDGLTDRSTKMIEDISTQNNNNNIIIRENQGYHYESMEIIV